MTRYRIAWRTPTMRKKAEHGYWHDEPRAVVQEWADWFNTKNNGQIEYWVEAEQESETEDESEATK